MCNQVLKTTKLRIPATYKCYFNKNSTLGKKKKKKDSKRYDKKHKFKIYTKHFPIYKILKLNYFNP